jgi:hypothetical protein
LQDPSSLPDCQPRPWSLVDKSLEDTLRLGEAVSRKQQFFDTWPIPAPFLLFLEVAPVGVERIVGFFVGPVVGHPLTFHRLWHFILVCLRDFPIQHF